MIKKTDRLILSFLTFGFILIIAVSASAQGPIVNKVSAGGHDVAVGDFPRDANLSLIAMEFSDGTVRGQITDRYSIPGRGWHGNVECLSVNGNQAWVGGVITHHHNPLAIGGYFYIRVEDNGTSRQDPPDRLSAAFTFINPGIQLCEEQYALPLFAMPDGQVKVN